MTKNDTRHFFFFKKIEIKRDSTTDPKFSPPILAPLRRCGSGPGEAQHNRWIFLGGASKRSRSCCTGPTEKRSADRCVTDRSAWNEAVILLFLKKKTLLQPEPRSAENGNGAADGNRWSGIYPRDLTKSQEEGLISPCLGGCVRVSFKCLSNLPRIK